MFNYSNEILHNVLLMDYSPSTIGYYDKLKLSVLYLIAADTINDLKVVKYVSCSCNWHVNVKLYVRI